MIHLLNSDTIIDLDDGDIEDFELRPLLEGVVNYGVIFLEESAETIYVLFIKDNIICFNRGE